MKTELMNLWQISRTACQYPNNTRYDRMQYCKKELSLKYPDMSPKQLWLFIDENTRVF